LFFYLVVFSDPIILCKYKSVLFT